MKWIYGIDSTEQGSESLWAVACGAWIQMMIDYAQTEDDNVEGDMSAAVLPAIRKLALDNSSSHVDKAHELTFPDNSGSKVTFWLRQAPDVISDAQARRIATEASQDQQSSIVQFARTGAIDGRLRDEVSLIALTCVGEDRRELLALDKYIGRAGGLRGPVDNWDLFWDDSPVTVEMID